MCSVAAALTEPSTTLTAAEWLLPRVTSHVDGEVLMPGEADAADLAAVRPFTCVNASVFCEVATPTEPSPTRVAAERLLSRVNSLVSEQAALAIERLHTDTAHKRPVCRSLYITLCSIDRLAGRYSMQ